MTRTLRGWLRYQWNMFYAWLFFLMYPAYGEREASLQKTLRDRDATIDVLLGRIKELSYEIEILKAAPVEEMDLDDSYPPIPTGGRN